VQAASAAKIADRDFEVSGWDVVFTVVPAAIGTNWKAACWPVGWLQALRVPR